MHTCTYLANAKSWDHPLGALANWLSGPVAESAMFDMNSSQNITKIGRLIRDDQAAAIWHLKLEVTFWGHLEYKRLFK